MAERKVLNKYIPPDINPNSRLQMEPAIKKGKVRLMAPFSMQCNTCGEFIYKGKKFNARKEDAYDEDYLGIQIYRFYIRCPLCASEITFKTDPKNTDYVAEHGALRNFEPWREETRAHEAVKTERKELEQNNALLALENRTLDSKREMDILDALDEMLTKNAQMEKVDPELVLKKINGRADIIEPSKAERLQNEEDERIAKSIFTDADGEKVKRIHEDSLELSESPLVAGSSAAAMNAVNVTAIKTATRNPSTAPAKASILGIKRKKSTISSTQSDQSSKSVKLGSVKSLLTVDYASSSDDD